MAIRSNVYQFPAGYRKPVAPYLVYNASGSSLLIPPSPARFGRGDAQQLAIASVPADLSTLIITAPNGAAYTFQFVYNASVQNIPGSIKIPLPLSGASTAAQTTTAMNAVLTQIPAFNLAGNPVFLPWDAIQGDATHITLNYTVPGAGNPLGGTQVTITQGFLTPSTFTAGAIVPARIGPALAFLPGN